jgi:hypothetical protein
MCLGEGSNIGCLGDDPFAALGVGIDLLLQLHGITVSVTRHDTTGASDIYGEPLDTPTPFDAVVLLVKHELQEGATEAGGKQNEMLTLVGAPGTLLANDVVAYGGHLYDVRSVGKTVAQSAIVAEVYTAVSEVDV